jgi:hypothetical protein
MSIFMYRRVWLSVFFLLAPVSSPGQEQGDLHPYLANKFSLDVGMFFPDRQFEIGVDGPINSVAGDIDFETQFGLKKSDDLFALNFGWKFGKKWELGAQYFESDGQRSRALEEDVEWGDYVFGAGTGVTAGLDFLVIRAFFGRNFDSADHHDFGVGLGIHYMEIGAFIEGLAILNGQQAGFRRESVKAEAPLPNIGAWYVRSLSDRWAVRARLDWLSASVGDYDGTLINASAGINYRLFRNAGLGLSYNLFRLDVGVDDNGWRGDVNTTYKGLFVHASISW